MPARKIVDKIYSVGAVDWNRRLFDSLIPLPDGTSYNAYLIQGSEKTVLIDTVDPEMVDVLLDNLSEVKGIDYIVSQHSEQDHSGSIPIILDRYSEAVVLCSRKAEDLLIEHLGLPEDRIRIVGDGEVLSLGDKTLQFIYTPWVHWPETMVTHLQEDRILFSCDFFGSHMATSNLFAGDDALIYDAAKRYYAEIMMPYRKIITKNLAKLQGFEFSMIAPSHGPIYEDPDLILSAYEEWTSDDVSNLVVIPYVSMHGSTEEMVTHLVSALIERGVMVQEFELSVTDIGKLAMALVDAATIVIGTPTVLVGPHPAVVSATYLTNVLRPKVKHLAIIGSYGWGTKAVDQLTNLIPNLKVEMLDTILCKGRPTNDTFAALDSLAESIREKHLLN
jgi:flavorubredoxin